MPIWEKTTKEDIEKSLFSLEKLYNFEIISEIIIIYDGKKSKKIDFYIPTKLSGKVIKKFIAKNSGPGVARNIGVENSSSKYIFLIDAGDTCHQERINLQYPMVIKYGVSYSNIEYINNSKSFISKSIGIKNAKKILPFKNPYPGVTLAIERKLFLKIGGFAETRFAEDWVLSAKLLKICKYINYIERPLVTTYDIDNAIFRRRGWKILKEVLKAHLIMTSKSLYNLTFFPLAVTYQIFLRLLPSRIFRMIYRLRLIINFIKTK